MTEQYEHVLDWPPTETNNKLKILSIDGGGVRGLLAIETLVRIEQRHPEWRKQIDVFAGTSTGSCIATLLAVGMSATKVRDLYLRHLPIIFSRPLCHRLRTCGGLCGPRYRIEPLMAMGQEVLGNKCFRDLKQGLIVTSYDIARMEPKIYMNDFSHCDQKLATFYQSKPSCINAMDVNDPWFAPATPDVMLRDAVLRSCAAPTFFPSVDGMVDGAVYANNPLGIALACLHINRDQLKHIQVLSIGTGIEKKSNDMLIQSAGLLHWGRKIIELLMRSASQLCSIEIGRLLGDQYRRINATLPRRIALDEVRAIPLLRQIGQQCNIDWTWIDDFFNAK